MTRCYAIIHEGECILGDGDVWEIAYADGRPFVDEYRGFVNAENNLVRLEDVGMRPFFPDLKLTRLAPWFLAREAGMRLCKTFKRPRKYPTESQLAPYAEHRGSFVDGWREARKEWEKRMIRGVP